MELHHPIMSKLWDPGGRTQRKKEKEGVDVDNEDCLPENLPTSENENQIPGVSWVDWVRGDVVRYECTGTVYCTSST